MPRVIIAEGAAHGLERCRRFLAAKVPEAAKRAAKTIEQHFQLLEHTPDIGRPFVDLPDELRALIIPFGASGCIALYRHESADDAVYILAFRRMREAGYEVNRSEH
jgi:plasmid stabilization system protein ParE